MRFRAARIFNQVAFLQHPYNLLSVADAFGVDAIKDTFDSAMRSWSSDIKYLTELTMVMSWKCGIYFEEGNYEYNHLYHDLYYTVKDYVYDHFEDDDLDYFYSTTD